MLAVKNSDLSHGLSGILTTCVGYTLILFMPLYLEFVAQALSLNESQVGWLAATDAGGLALSALLFAIFIKRLNFRYVVIVGCAIAIAGNLWSMKIEDYQWLCVIRTITGFGEGLVVAAGISVVGMVSNPNRWFGLYTAAVVVVQGIGLILLPIIKQKFELEGLFIFFALLFLLPLITLNQLPKHSVANDGKTHAISSTKKKYLLLALLGQLIFYAGIGGVWAYISLMGNAQGLNIDIVSQYLAISMVIGALGGVAFAMLGKRGDSQRLFAISIAIMIFCMVGLIEFSASSYLIVLCIFSFFWSLLGARLFAVVSDADQSGKYISGAQTVLSLGYMIGPIIAAMLFDDFSYKGILTMAAIAFILCFACVIPLIRELAQQ